MAGLELEHLHKRFGETEAVVDVSFSVAPRELAAILGPSGCGKSTVLHLIAGLENPDRGRVLWDGDPLDGVPAHERGFGLMFQEFALFPHMNVADNVRFGLRMQRMAPAEVQPRLTEVLELVGLPGFQEREVDQLSGGERQRVALARALAPKPRLLMLDEPLGALDRTLKERLMIELPQILRSTRQTVLYVTHDQEEAFAVADRVVVMNKGRVAQTGTPEGIYRRPNSVFVARFLGLNNVIEGRVERSDGGSVARTKLGAIPLEEAADGAVTLLLRPETATLEGEGDIEVEGELVERSFRGSSQRMVLRLEDGQRLSFDLSSQTALPPLGETVTLRVDSRDAVQRLT